MYVPVGREVDRKGYAKGFGLFLQQELSFSSLQMRKVQETSEKEFHSPKGYSKRNMTAHY